jgi:uncharacterized repeat protein (TIGR02543 family)
MSDYMTTRTYTITFDQQSGTGGSSSVTARMADAMPEADMPTREGHDFHGYYTEVSGGGTQYYDEDGASARAWDQNNDIKLYAYWTPQVYTITYKDKDDAEFTGYQPGAPTSHTYGTATDLIIPAREGYAFAGWFTASNCASGGVGNTSSASLAATGYTANITLYAKWTDTKVYMFKGGTTGHAKEWNQTGNWTRGVVPGATDTVRLLAELDIATGSTIKIAHVDIVTGGTYTPVGESGIDAVGKLVIEAGGELIVTDSVARVASATTPNTKTSTRDNDIIIGSSEDDGLGALVMGEHSGTNKATVYFATLSHGTSGSSASVSQYVGTPFCNEPEMVYQFYNSWMYKLDYDANNDVSDDVWVRVTGDEGLKAFDGYCVISADAAHHVYEMSGTLCASTDVTNKALKYGTASTENMLANSWMAPILISAFKSTDFVNTTATIYMFNSGSPDDAESAGSAAANATDPAQWIALPINASPWVGIKVIPAMQSFSVYTTGANPKITLDYSRLVYDPAVAGTAAIVANRAPRRAPASADDPEVLKLAVKGNNRGYSDKVVMLAREDFSDGFDNGWDGRKIEGESLAPQMYAKSAEGNMAVDCVQDIEGTVLGFRKGSEDSQYTFSFEYEGENTWYLNDLQEQESTLIENGNTYVFDSRTDDSEARFVVSATPIRKIATGVEGTGDGTKARKLLIEDKLFIIRGGHMYSADGAMVR